MKSVPSADIFAASEGIEEGKTIAKAYSELLDMDIKLRLDFDSIDLFFFLPAQNILYISQSAVISDVFVMNSKLVLFLTYQGFQDIPTWPIHLQKG